MPPTQCTTPTTEEEVFSVVAEVFHTANGPALPLPPSSPLDELIALPVSSPLLVAFALLLAGVK